MNEIINDPKATIIDVRSEGEFSMGHVPGSINMPLQTVPDRVEEINAFSRPIVLCCASGNRSAQAKMFLESHGVEGLHNGGGWTDVQIHKM
jgi:rhodanese-related sulfurtransferase